MLSAVMKGNENPSEVLVVEPGFSDKGSHDFAEAFGRVRSFSAIRVAKGCPPSCGGNQPDALVDDLDSVLESFPDAEITLAGDSYGSLLALRNACRRKMRRIGHLILIDGPLHPEVLVEPPPGNDFYDVFSLQYEQRARIATECLRAVSDMSPEMRGRIVTVGSKIDTVVPPAAKIIPGVCHHELPPNITGHSLSPDKIRAIVGFLTSEVFN